MCFTICELEDGELQLIEIGRQEHSITTYRDMYFIGALDQKDFGA